MWNYHHSQKFYHRDRGDKAGGLALLPMKIPIPLPSRRVTKYCKFIKATLRGERYNLNTK